MLDNLRRTSSAPAALAALLAGWVLPDGAPLIWSCFIVAIIALPALLMVGPAILPRRAGIDLRSHLWALRNDVWLAAAQTVLLITFLAHQAWLMLDAIAPDIAVEAAAEAS